MRHKRSRIVAALITLAWLASMGILIQRHYGPYEAPAGDVAPPEWLLQERWVGIYQGTKKAGYVVSQLTPEADGYRSSDRIYMKMTVMDTAKEIDMELDALLDEGLRLRSFTFNMYTDVDVKVEGEVQGKELLMTLDMGGVKTEKKLDMPEAPYMSPSLSPFMADLAPGEKFRVPIADPSSLSGDFMEMEVLGTDRITVMGLEREVLKLSGSFKGADTTIWATPDGEVLKEEGMGFTYIRESKEEAQKLGTVSVDYIADLSVPVEGEIPENAKYLKVRLKGIDTEGLELDGGVQSLSEGGVLEIRTPARLQSGGDVRGMDEYLNASMLIESDDPGIMDLAREIVEDESVTVHRARLLAEWAYANIEKVPTMTLPSALEVYESRRGDCNEHTALYTALARASGVPTRVAVGVVHQDGRFLYHAWPEVYLGGWVPVDPTWGQFPADATHIRLLTGGLENQLRLGSVIGRLGIEVIEAR